MSGCSYTISCPNCGKEADIYSDSKPFDYTSISCLYCGLQISPKITYQTLEELNESRKDSELKPLKRLPKQDKDF